MLNAIMVRVKQQHINQVKNEEKRDEKLIEHSTFVKLTTKNSFVPDMV